MLGSLFPHIRSPPNFGTNSGDDAQSSSGPRAGMPNAQSLAQSGGETSRGDARVGENYSLVPKQNKSKTSNLDPLLSDVLLSRLCGSVKPQFFVICFSPHHHCSQDSIQALLWRCIFMHWFQYESGGLPSAMRPLPIINGKEERREKGEGRLVAALATALLSATARF